MYRVDEKSSTMEFGGYDEPISSSFEYAAAKAPRIGPFAGKQNGLASCQPVVSKLNCCAISCPVLHTVAPTRPVAFPVRLFDFLFDPFCKLCGAKADCTLDVEARDKSGLGHFVNVLGSNSQHFRHLSNFQRLFAVFEYFDESHRR